MESNKEQEVIKMKSALAVVLAAGLALPGVGKTIVDLPSAGKTNAVFLTSLTERPWWNAAWTRRAPILVSSTVDENDEKVVVDAVVDFG